MTRAGNRTARGFALGLALLGTACAHGEASGDSAASTARQRAGEPPSTTARGRADLIRLHAPAPGQLVRSPLRVHGEARGVWFFEGDFPVQLLDADGKRLAVAPAAAQGEWMTEAFVAFEGELRFAPPATADGWLVLVKSNPSCLPEHADELRVPVRFAVP